MTTTIDFTQAADYDGMEALQDLSDEQLERMLDNLEALEDDSDAVTAWVLAVRDEQDAR